MRIFTRDQFTCRYCGRRPPEITLHVDHAYPISKGGSNLEGNLVTACAECNLGKAASIIPGLGMLATHAELAETMAPPTSRELPGYRRMLSGRRGVEVWSRYFVSLVDRETEERIVLLEPPCLDGLFIYPNPGSQLYVPEEIDITFGLDGRPGYAFLRKHQKLIIDDIQLPSFIEIQGPDAEVIWLRGTQEDRLAQFGTSEFNYILKFDELGWPNLPIPEAPIV